MEEKTVSTWSQAIDALGGPTQLGERLSRARCTISLWRNRGVPHEFRHRMVKDLIAQGFKIKGDVGPAVSGVVSRGISALGDVNHARD